MLAGTRRWGRAQEARLRQAMVACACKGLFMHVILQRGPKEQLQEHHGDESSGSGILMRACDVAKGSPADQDIVMDDTDDQRTVVAPSAWAWWRSQACGRGNGEPCGLRGLRGLDGVQPRSSGLTRCRGMPSTGSAVVPRSPFPRKLTSSDK